MSLCTLAEAKLQLNKTSTADDTEIQSYIDAVTAPLEEYCGPIVPRTVTEWPDWFVSSIMLDQPPLISVTSVTEYRGNSAYTYTQVNDPTSASTYTFIVDPALTGKITRVFNGGRTLPFTGPVKVVYQAGLASVPANINLAARLLVQMLWHTQNGGAGLPALEDEQQQQDLLVETIRSPRIQMLLGSPDHAVGIA